MFVDFFILFMALGQLTDQYVYLEWVKMTENDYDTESHRESDEKLIED